MMSRVIHIDRKDVPQTILNAFPYDGRTFRVELHESVKLLGMFYDGGSRRDYTAVDMATGAIARVDDEVPLRIRFGGPQEAPLCNIPKGIAIVEHVISCGKDRGIRIHLRPDDFQVPIGDGLELSIDEKLVLACTRQFKSSYGGIKEFRFHEAKEMDSSLTKERWESAKSTLIEKGMLNKRGALTTKGRNNC